MNRPLETLASTVSQVLETFPKAMPVAFGNRQPGFGISTCPYVNRDPCNELP